LGSGDVHIVAHKEGVEGFQVPSKLYGILAAGKPCIAVVASKSEVALTITESECGIVVRPGDPDALADAILEMRSAPLEALGGRARTAFLAKYDRHTATESYRRL